MTPLDHSRCTDQDCDAEWWTADDESPLSLDAAIVIQKSRVFYQTELSPEILDSMCEVPSIPEDDSYESLADNCLGGMAEWQRELDPLRVVDIGQFWSEPNTNLVNPPVVAFREDADISIVDLDTRGVTSLKLARIGIESWFRKQCPKEHVAPGGKATDRCYVHGCTYHRKPYPKPAVIIDGQHRVRGLASDAPSSKKIRVLGGTEEYASRVPIPLIILSAKGLNAFDENTQARIFADITTKAEDLQPLHKLWLLYRFPGMRARIEDLDLPQPVTMDSGDNIGKSIRTGYEAILSMVGTKLGASGTTNPWRNNVPIFRPKQRASRITSLERLLPLIYVWVRPKGPLAGKLPQQIATELRDYVIAIIKQWDRLSPSGRYYWTPPLTTHRSMMTGDKGVISHPEGGAMSTWFRALMRLVPTVYGRLPTTVSAPSVADFEAIFSHLAHCHFEGPGWEDFLGQEARENLLYYILESYLLGGTVVREMATLGYGSLNDYVREGPKFDVAVAGDGGKGPTTGELLVIPGKTKLSWPRPFNTLGGSNVTVTQSGKPDPYEDDVRVDRGAVIDYTLQSPMFDPALHGSRVEIRIRQYNHVATTAKAMTFEIP